MPFDPTSAGPTLEHVGWVLLHFLWQGALLAALFRCANFCLRRRSANARYVAGCVTLLLMAAAPAVTFAILRATSNDQTNLLLRSEHVDRFIAMPFLGGAGAVSGAGVDGAAGASTVAAAPAVGIGKARLNQFLPWISIGWIVGVVLMALRQLGGWVWLTYTVRSATLPLDDPRLHELAKRLVRRPVRFLESAMLHAPATLGVLRPIVLLPVAAISGLTPRQLEAIMAHELAHIRRWDYVVNVMQGAIEAGLFFHPAVWWVSRRVREERENCCDDIAVGVVGDRTFYVVALEKLERLRPDPVPPLALAATGGNLVTRIGRLLGVQPYDLAKVGRGAGVIWATGCGVVLLLAVELLAASSAQRWAVPAAPRVRIGSSVYAALDLAHDGRGDPLAAIAAVVASPAGDAVALRTLAVSLAAGGDPDALSRAAFERMEIDSAVRYQSSPDWRYGSFPQRYAILTRLLDRARDADPANVNDRPLYARAALALAAQDAALFGNGTLKTILDAPQITEAAGLSEAALADVRTDVAQHDATSRAFAMLLIRAKRALAQGPAAPSTRAAAAEVIGSLRGMAPLTRGRADLQWHLANVTWQYQSRAPAAADALVAEINAAVGSAHFARWMAQSTTLPPPPVRAAVPITHKELAQLRNVTRQLREKLSVAPAAPSR